MTENKFENLLDKYNYELPKELIAQNPAKPRDSAKLLVYNRKTNRLFFDVFKNIGKYIPKNSVLVFNQTKVVPARLKAFKETGGKVEIFYVGQEKTTIKVIANRKLQKGSKVVLNKKTFFTVISQKEQFYFLKPSFPLSQTLKILNKFGSTPLPPYIKNSKLKENQKREQYQTVFAKTGMSVAAPTASLHFTKKLIQSLKKQGVKILYVNLDVNLGTFAPLKPENIRTKKLHTENYWIENKTYLDLLKAKKQGMPILAVGTTVVRTLESMYKTKKQFGPTSLFINENTPLKIVNNLITNFHVPKSSLLMLVSAFTGRKKLLELYQKVIKKRMRFFSFGDAMLIV